jgi:mono/diheme cytochrome c family protein/plastocyanin
MTDDERRLPANRPGQSTELTTERFSAPPSVRATGGLTPERAAGIVRQSSSARWVGFLTICVVSLFVVLYWFYELGFPLGLSEARLNEEIEHQQVTAVERGYNIYQANCARCHGPNGLGPNEEDAAEKAAAGQPYIGPELNSQEKLFAHLSEAYIRNVLEVGGRYVCGNPLSAMPAWSDTANPPGPLNYRQIDELVAFLRATNEVTYEIKDPELNEPLHDEETGEALTFTGWRDPNYKPEPGATPYPECWTDALSGGPGATPGPGAGASIDPNAESVTVAAPTGAATTGFEPTELQAPADTAFTLVFDNQDATAPHNVVVNDAAGEPVPMGDTSLFTGPGERSYAMPALAAGEYPFLCQAHPTTMTGTITVE